jgi:hypothetical protein
MHTYVSIRIDDAVTAVPGHLPFPLQFFQMRDQVGLLDHVALARVVEPLICEGLHTALGHKRLSAALRPTLRR